MIPCCRVSETNVCINQNFPPEVKQKASIYVPAIGKVTIAVLLRNLLRITQNRLLQENVQKQQQDGNKAEEAAAEPVERIEKILDP